MLFGVSAGSIKITMRATLQVLRPTTVFSLLEPRENFLLTLYSSMYQIAIYKLCTLPGGRKATKGICACKVNGVSQCQASRAFSHVLKKYCQRVSRQQEKIPLANHHYNRNVYCCTKTSPPLPRCLPRAPVLRYPNPFFAYNFLVSRQH